MRQQKILSILRKIMGIMGDILILLFIVLPDDIVMDFPFKAILSAYAMLSVIIILLCKQYLVKPKNSKIEKAISLVLILGAVIRCFVIIN